MAFPTNPTNGQQSNVNGVIYIYSSTLTAWTVLTNTGANVSANNVAATNNLTATTVSATGNIVTQGYVLGNGSLLTGVSTSSANINSGTSNVTIVSSGGNATVGIGGTANIAVFATTGEYVTGVLSASGNITGANILTAGLTSVTGNATAGNILTAGLMSSTGNAIHGNILTAGLMSSTGNAIHGNILTAGLISATGNIITGTNGFIGIGTATPDTELNILGNPQTVSYPITGNSTTVGTDLHISGADGGQTRITQDSFGANVYVAFTGRTARGTAAAPTQTLLGDTISQFTGRGFSNGSLQFGNSSTGRVDIVAAENFTDTSRASNVVIYTTATTSITPTAVATFSSANGLSVTGNIQGNYILGNGSQLTGVASGNSSVTITTTTISANYTIANGQNGLSVGPMTYANNVQVSVAAGQRWIIL